VPNRWKTSSVFQDPNLSHRASYVEEKVTHSQQRDAATTTTTDMNTIQSKIIIIIIIIIMGETLSTRSKDDAYSPTQVEKDVKNVTPEGEKDMQSVIHEGVSSSEQFHTYPVMNIGSVIHAVEKDVTNVIHEVEKDVTNVIHEGEKDVQDVKKKAQQIFKTLGKVSHDINDDWKKIVSTCSYLIGAFPTIIDAIESCKIVKSDCEMLLSGNVLFGAFELGLLTIKDMHGHGLLTTLDTVYQNKDKFIQTVIQLEQTTQNVMSNVKHTLQLYHQHHQHHEEEKEKEKEKTNDDNDDDDDGGANNSTCSSGEKEDVNAAESVLPLVAVEGVVPNTNTGKQNEGLDQGEETNAGENDDVDVAESVSPLDEEETTLRLRGGGTEVETESESEDDDSTIDEKEEKEVVVEEAVPNTDTGEQNEGLDSGEESNVGKNNDDVDAAKSSSFLVAAEEAVPNTDTGEQNEGLDSGEESNVGKNNDDVDAAKSSSFLVAAEEAVPNTDTGEQNEDLDPGEETNAGSPESSSSSPSTASATTTTTTTTTHFSKLEAEFKKIVIDCEHITTFMATNAINLKILVTDIDTIEDDWKGALQSIGQIQNIVPLIVEAMIEIQKLELIVRAGFVAGVVAGPVGAVVGAAVGVGGAVSGVGALLELETKMYHVLVDVATLRAFLTASTSVVIKSRTIISSYKKVKRHRKMSKKSERLILILGVFFLLSAFTIIIIERKYKLKKNNPQKIEL